MRKSKVYIVILMAAILLAGCTHTTGSNPSGGSDILEEEPSKPLSENNKKESSRPQSSAVTTVFSGAALSDDKLKEIQAQCLALASIYQEIYANAEKQPAVYLGKSTINRESIDEIETVIGEAGYPVLNSDSFYPAFLEHSENFYAFWESVQSSIDAETSYWGVSSSGGLNYHEFQYSDGTANHITALAEWNDEGQLQITEAGMRKVLNWGMTYQNDFYYQDVPINRHWEASSFLRLHPADRDLYDLNKKYVESIGYYNVNIFLCDWDTSDYGDLCFNDLFEYLYKIKNNDYVYTDSFEREKEPFFHYCIPAELFEETVLTHFEIPLSEFQERTLYNAEKDIYPWQDINASNVAYFETITPEVTEMVKNTDGSITLKVHVMCFDRQTDTLFTHEVTVMPADDGGFKYLGNKITYRGEKGMPSSQPRISAQRTDVVLNQQ